MLTTGVTTNDTPTAPANSRLIFHTATAQCQIHITTGALPTPLPIRNISTLTGHPVPSTRVRGTSSLSERSSEHRAVSSSRHRAGSPSSHNTSSSSNAESRRRSHSPDSGRKSQPSSPQAQASMKTQHALDNMTTPSRKITGHQLTLRHAPSARHLRIQIRLAPCQDIVRYRPRPEVWENLPFSSAGFAQLAPVLLRGILFTTFQGSMELC